MALNAAEPAQCQQQLVANVVSEMCLLPGAAFHHDQYTLRVGQDFIFSLVDDFVEKVNLQHTIPAAATLELPLSRQDHLSVNIHGGCAPESKDGIEVARVCNFFWGKYQVVKNVRFDFK